MKLLNTIVIEGTIELCPEVIREKLYLIIKNEDHLYNIILENKKQIVLISSLRLNTKIRVIGKLKGSFIIAEIVEVRA